MVLAVAAAAILGAYVGQMTLNEHARNLSLAIHDANRVMEQIRQQNASCVGNPSVIPPGGAGTSWNTWMNAGNPGAPKSLQPSGDTNERLVVTCQDRDGAVYCDGTQVGNEWHAKGGAPQNPLRVTVAVCWRHRNRTIGECGWTGGALTASPATDANGNGVIESPAMLTTLVTCRG